MRNYLKCLQYCAPLPSPLLLFSCSVEAGARVWNLAGSVPKSCHLG